MRVESVVSFSFSSGGSCLSWLIVMAGGESWWLM